MNIERIVARALRTPEGVIHETNAGLVKSAKEMGTHLSLVGRWGIALMLHPVATTRLALMIGDRQTQQRDAFAAFGYKETPKAS